MGVVWWCAGLLGVWLSRKRDGKPKRNLFPAMVIILTGWGMGAHPQSLELSTHVHSMFGYTLMAAGLARIVEISFVLKDQNSLSDSAPEETNSFQYLTPFVSPSLIFRKSSWLTSSKLLYTSGFLFMGATEEQMNLLTTAGISHVSYILALYSIAFLLFLFVTMLLHLYATYAWTLETNKSKTHSAVAGNGRITRDNQRLSDAEEFELEGLMSEDDDGDETVTASGRRKQNGRAT